MPSIIDKVLDKKMYYFRHIGKKKAKMESEKNIGNVFGLIHLKGCGKDGDERVRHMLQNMLERLAYFFSHCYVANSICMNLYFCPEYLLEAHRFLFSGCGRENYELLWPS